MKQVTSINAITKPYDGFWVKSAYRVPRGKFPMVDRFISQETDVNTPITEMVVNSLITNIGNGQQVAAGRPLEVKGVAWDGGFGIARVGVSIDGGQTWRNATLGAGLREILVPAMELRLHAHGAGSLTVMANATNRAGQTQTFELIANPAGYHHNLVQRVTLAVA